MIVTVEQGGKVEIVAKPMLSMQGADTEAPLCPYGDTQVDQFALQMWPRFSRAVQDDARVATFMLGTMSDATKISDFWHRARSAVSSLPVELAEAWAFGATAQQAEDLLDLVLAGTKTATASSLWDYEASGDAVPLEGELSIILDGTGTPRAVIETTDVRIVPFDHVDADHAYLEGEGDRTLEHWRTVHTTFWRKYSENPRGFDAHMPVVCETFRVLYREDKGSSGSISVTPQPHWFNGWFLRLFARPSLRVDGIDRVGRWGHATVIVVEPGIHRVSVGAQYRGTRTALGAVVTDVCVAADEQAEVVARNGFFNHQPFVIHERSS
jgi:uncharacterized protein YhfF